MTMVIFQIQISENLLFLIIVYYLINGSATKSFIQANQIPT